MRKLTLAFALPVPHYDEIVLYRFSGIILLMTTRTSTLENICRNEKLVSEHSERNTEENNEDEGEMETERHLPILL
jgi:hypothetical protein